MSSEKKRESEELARMLAEFEKKKAITKLTPEKIAELKLRRQHIKAENPRHQWETRAPIKIDEDLDEVEISPEESDDENE